jgi:arsenate reductase-like glutaredoxin family protein
MAKQVDKLYSIRGQKVTELDLRKEPSTGTLKKLLLGPTGNLRAPAIRTGKTLVVGFHRETWEILLK